MPPLFFLGKYRFLRFFLKICVEKPFYGLNLDTLFGVIKTRCKKNVAVVEFTRSVLGRICSVLGKICSVLGKNKVLRVFPRSTQCQTNFLL